jgi:hypothetical protein
MIPCVVATTFYRLAIVDSYFYFRLTSGLSVSMPSARPITDTCANYNAFGRDPNGLIAYLAGICFGPRWVPPYTVQQFVGRLEPPRYGPPAPYQIPCLPEGFIPRSPPNILGMTAEELNNEDSWIDPPSPFDPLMFEALRPVKSSKRTKKGQIICH